MRCQKLLSLPLSLSCLMSTLCFQIMLQRRSSELDLEENNNEVLSLVFITSVNKISNEHILFSDVVTEMSEMSEMSA